ncbi:hypothetical protein [Rhodococcus sp. NPDC127528]|uniref:hypothetical protein n=1 Tax=unclassified Rhodococcus (in: high G+C Gram-positive bacteria) TaxID=192944 RepID=UPI00362696AA
MANNVSLRIMRLRDLIEHPRTGDSERAAAERMLERVLDKSQSRTQYGYGDRTYGSRHDRIGQHAGLSRIADMIREDIALARVTFPAATTSEQVAVKDPIGDAPRGISFTVETPHDASIDITIRGVPRDWGWDGEDGVETVSASLRALAGELAAIMNGYNRNGSDAEKRFFGRVRVGSETLEW